MQTKCISFVGPNIQTWQINITVEETECNLERNKHSVTLRKDETQKIVQQTEGCGQHKILHRR